MSAPRRLRRTTPLALLLPALLAACTERDEPPPEPTEVAGAGDSVIPPAADPETEVVRRWLARLPAGLLVRSGVCPFECCIYGDWLAQSEIPVVSEPRSAAALARGRISPGERFRADSGRVYVTGPALYAVSDTVEEPSGVTLLPGDTLVVLDYIGEGYYHAWRDGEVAQVTGYWMGQQANPRGELIGRHESEWWVHVTLPGGVGGWFRADAPGVDFHGADACGGPAPL